MQNHIRQALNMDQRDEGGIICIHLRVLVGGDFMYRHFNHFCFHLTAIKCTLYVSLFHGH